MDPEHQYKPLSNNDNANEQETPHKPSVIFMRTNKILTYIACALFFVGIGITTSFYAQDIHPRGPIWKNCGNSSAEALAQGCTFDIMMNGWMTAECYQRELSESYLAAGNFRFFADSLGFDEVPLEVVRKGEHTHIFTTADHHLTHCSFMWKLQGLALVNRLWIDERSTDYAHTSHCAERLLESHTIEVEGQIGNGSRLPIKINTGFIACRSY